MSSQNPDRPSSPAVEEEETYWETKINDGLDLWDTFRYFIYNPYTGKIMGRTRRSLGQITVFFLIFYACLAAFFAICMSVFLTTIPERNEGPKYTDIIGKPGSQVATTTIRLHFGESKTRQGLMDANDRLMKASNYDPTNPESALIKSIFSPPSECLPPHYGTDSKPCLLFTFNRISGWVPKDRLQVVCTLSGNLVEYAGPDQVSVFPTDGFTEASDHFPYHPGREIYNQPVGVIQFDFTLAKALLEDQNVTSLGGRRAVRCDDKFGQLAFGFKIDITLTADVKTD